MCEAGVGLPGLREGGGAGVVSGALVPAASKGGKLPVVEGASDVLVLGLGN
jgi:hypothetical protein